MDKKIIYLFLLYLTAGVISSSFAQEAALEDKRPQVALSADNIAKNMPAFMFNLEKYVKKAERNIKQIDEKMRKEGILTPAGEDERNAMIYAEIGDLAYKNGRLEDAMNSWQQAEALTKMPELKRSLKKLENKANAELNRESKAAERALLKDKKKEVLSSEPDKPMSSVEEYICSLGVVYYERGEYSSARSEFDKALVINPDNKIARDYLNRIALLNSYSPAKKD